MWEGSLAGLAYLPFKWKWTKKGEGERERELRWRKGIGKQKIRNFHMGVYDFENLCGLKMSLPLFIRQTC